MGSTVSIERALCTPLAAQYPSPAAVNPRFCSARHMLLELADGFWTTVGPASAPFEVREAAAGAGGGREVFRVVSSIDGVPPDRSSRWVLDTIGLPVARLAEAKTAAPLPPGAVAYELSVGTTQPRVVSTFTVHAASTQCPLSLDFQDAKTGERCRIGCAGVWRDRGAFLFIERGVAAPRQAIAKIYRPDYRPAPFAQGASYHVEIAPGVDMALVVLVCAAMDDATARRQQLAAARAKRVTTKAGAARLRRFLPRRS